MGDPRRFSLFADLISRNWPSSQFVCDVAGGKGHLQSALRERGFGNVVSWDKLPKYSKGHRAKFYRYGHFDYQDAPKDYSLVVGMHPDEGTDHIVQYAIKNRKPFAVCPCCIRPSAVSYWGSSHYLEWCAHLYRMASDAGFFVWETELPMYGRNVVLVGSPR